LDGELTSLEALKSGHFSYIQELYRDRKAPVIPFDRESILATCYSCLDQNKRKEFFLKSEDLKAVFILYNINMTLLYIT
jgi:hypothetical protein